MSAFTVVRTTELSVAAAWAAVADLRRHGQVVPMTRMRLDPGEPGVGWGFSAGTGLGSAMIWDHMIITRWAPPDAGRLRGELGIVKTGAWLSGWANITVEAAGDGARVEWTEEIGPGFDPAPRLTGPVARRLGERLFGMTLDRLLDLAPDSAGIG